MSCGAFILASLSASAEINITKSHGGINGYREVKETHSGIIFKDHNLSCSEPGKQSCTWTIQPSIRSSDSDTPIEINTELVDASIEAMIEDGDASGSFPMSEQNATVNWSGTDKYNYSYTISAQ